MTLKSLFSFHGRFSRSQFWLWGIGLPALVGALSVGLISALVLPVADSDGVVGIFIVMGLLYLPLTIVGIASSVKRLHDLDRSGWWYLLALIPLANLFLAIWIGAFKGSSGANQYGENSHANITSRVPSKSRQWVVIGTEGQYRGCEFPLNEQIIFGTDPKQCSVVIDGRSYPTVQDKHCTLHPIPSEMPSLIFHEIDEDDRTNPRFDYASSLFHRSRIIKLASDLSFEVRSAT